MSITSKGDETAGPSEHGEIQGGTEGRDENQARARAETAGHTDRGRLVRPKTSDQELAVERSAAKRANLIVRMAEIGMAMRPDSEIRRTAATKDLRREVMEGESAAAFKRRWRHAEEVERLDEAVGHYSPIWADCDPVKLEAARAVGLLPRPGRG